MAKQPGSDSRPKLRLVNNSRVRILEEDMEDLCFPAKKLDFKALMPWIVCFSASLFFFYEFIQGNMFASIADNIMHDFNLKADTMAYLSSVYYVSNVIFLFLAGIVLDKFSTKKTIIFAMLLCVVSTFVFAEAQSFYLVIICRFITGIGSAFCFLGPIRLASRWFPPKRMAFVTGAIVTMAMTGGMLAQYPLTYLVSQFGWRHALLGVGCLGVLILLIMIVGIVDKTSEKQPKLSSIPLSEKIKRIYLNFQTIRAALYASLMNMGIAVFGAMIGTLYLVQRLDVPKETAALVNSFLFLGAIIGGPVIGWISDKLRLRILPMLCGVILSLLTIVAILYLPVSVFLMKTLFFLLGFFTAAQIISYAYVAESNPRTVTAMAVSVVSIIVQGGYVIYQNIFSYLLTSHGEMQMIAGTPVYSLGDYLYAASILPIGFCIALLALFKLKETHGQPLEM